MASARVQQRRRHASTSRQANRARAPFRGEGWDGVEARATQLRQRRPSLGADPPGPPVTGQWIVNLATGIAANIALGGMAYRARSIDGRGLVAGVCVGASVYFGLGWRGFLCLATFFVLGTAATRVGRAVKAAHGPRTARHVLANGSVPACASLAAVAFPGHAVELTAACAGALAAATADTLASELGRVYGGTPYLLTTLRRVPVGENGGVTIFGTLVGLAGATALAAVAVLLGLVGSVVAIAVAGAAGNLVDSAFGATLERRGVMSNAGVNLACTLAGASVAAWWA